MNTDCDVCFVCEEGGSLIGCDGCPNWYHQDCARLIGVPEGDWYCNNCSNGQNKTSIDEEELFEDSDEDIQPRKRSFKRPNPFDSSTDSIILD